MKTLIATLMIAAPLVAISHSAVAETAPKAKADAAKKAPVAKKATTASKKGKAAAAAAALSGRHKKGAPQRPFSFILMSRSASA